MLAMSHAVMMSMLTGQTNRCQAFTLRFLLDEANILIQHNLRYDMIRKIYVHSKAEGMASLI